MYVYVCIHAVYILGNTVDRPSNNVHVHKCECDHWHWHSRITCDDIDSNNMMYVNVLAWKRKVY